MSAESRAKVWTDFKDAIAQRSYVFQLDLSRQGLRSLEETVGQLNKVESCNLSHNDLTALPDQFFELSRRPPSTPSARDPESARALSHDWHAELTSLDISNNHFERLPPLLTTLLDLKHLNIRGNSIPNAREQVGSWAQFRCRSTRLRAGLSRAHKCDPLNFALP
jgi:hypothetical protein